MKVYIIVDEDIISSVVLSVCDISFYKSQWSLFTVKLHSIDQVASSLRQDVRAPSTIADVFLSPTINITP